MVFLPTLIYHTNQPFHVGKYTMFPWIRHGTCIDRSRRAVHLAIVETTRLGFHGGLQKTGSPPIFWRGSNKQYLAGGNSNSFYFCSYFGEEEPILTSIFFKGVGTTN